MILPGVGEIQEASRAEQLLTRIAANQVAIHQVLVQISHQQEIQLRILSGADSKNSWKERFAQADAAQRAEERLAAEAASGRDIDDVGVHSEPEEAVEDGV